MSDGIQMPLFGFDSTVVPDIDFCVKDASLIESDVISKYENMFYLITKINKTLGRGDPVRLFLLSIIYQIVVPAIDCRFHREGKPAQIFTRRELRQPRCQVGA